MVTRKRWKIHHDRNSEASSDDQTLYYDTESENSSQTGEAPRTADDVTIDDADTTVIDSTAEPIPGYQEFMRDIFPVKEQPKKVFLMPWDIVCQQAHSFVNTSPTQRTLAECEKHVLLWLPFVFLRISVGFIT